MIRDIGQDSFQQAHMCDSLKDDSETPLYTGCSSFTCLSAVLKLFNIKERNGWINKIFTKLLELLHEMLPKDNSLLTRMRRRRYCVQWVWSTRKYMHVLMFAYCIEKSLNHCTSVQDAGYHDKK